MAAKSNTTLSWVSMVWVNMAIIIIINNSKTPIKNSPTYLVPHQGVKHVPDPGNTVRTLLIMMMKMEAPLKTLSRKWMKLFYLWGWGTSTSKRIMSIIIYYFSSYYTLHVWKGRSLLRHNCIWFIQDMHMTAYFTYTAWWCLQLVSTWITLWSSCIVQSQHLKCEEATDTN